MFWYLQNCYDSVKEAWTSGNPLLHYILSRGKNNYPNWNSFASGNLILVTVASDCKIRIHKEWISFSIQFCKKIAILCTFIAHLINILLLFIHQHIWIIMHKYITAGSVQVVVKLVENWLASYAQGVPKHVASVPQVPKQFLSSVQRVPRFVIKDVHKPQGVPKQYLCTAQGVPRLVYRTCTNWALAWAHE